MHGRENPYREEEQAPPPQRRSSRAASLTRPIAIVSCVLAALCLVAFAAFMRTPYQWWGDKLILGLFIFPILGASYGQLVEHYASKHPELDARGDLERGENAMEDVWKWFARTLILWLALGAALNNWLF